MSHLNIIVGLLLLLSMKSGVADEAKIDFRADVMPLLSRHCVACHNVKKPEGGLNLESFSALMKGGDSGEAVLVGNATESELLLRMTAEDDLVMPPPENKVGAKRLSPQEIQTIQKWIQQGAKNSTVLKKAMQWNPLPHRFTPVYAMQMTSDGRHLVAGRGSQVSITPLFGEQTSVALLSDPQLGEAKAHRDLVHAIAISQDNQWIATGGYRCVKLWRQKHGLERIQKQSFNPEDVKTISTEGDLMACLRKNQQLSLLDVRNPEQPLVEWNLKGAEVSSFVWLKDHFLFCNQQGAIQAYSVSGKQKVEVLTEAIKGIEQWQRLGTNKFVGLTTDGQLARLELKQVTGSQEEPSQWRLEETVLPFEKPIVRIATGGEDDPPLIACVSEDNHVSLLNADGKAQGKSWDLKALPEMLFLDRSGSYLMTIGKDQPVQLWSTEEAKRLFEFTRSASSLLSQDTLSKNTSRQQKRIDQLEKKLGALKKSVEKETEAQKKAQQEVEKAEKAQQEAEEKLNKTKEPLTLLQQTLEELKKADPQQPEKIAEVEKKIAAEQKKVEAEQKKLASAHKTLANRKQALGSATDTLTRSSQAVKQTEQTTKQEQQQLAQLQQKTEELKGKQTLGNVLGASLLPESNLLAIVDQVSGISTFDLKTGVPVQSIPLPEDVLAVSKASSNVLSLYTVSGACYHWNAQTSWELNSQIGTAVESPFTGRVTALDFSPTGEQLLVGGGDPSRMGEVQIYDVVTSKQLESYSELHSDTVLALRFSPSGDYFASAGADKVCRVVDLRSHKTVWNLEGHTHYVQAVSWQDDEQVLVTAGADEVLKVWNLQTGQQTRTIKGFGKEINALKFIDYGSEFVVVSSDGHVKRINSQNGSQVRVYTKAPKAVYSVSYSSQANVVAAGDQSGTIQLWNMSDGKPVKTLEGK